MTRPVRALMVYAVAGLAVVPTLRAQDEPPPSGVISGRVLTQENDGFTALSDVLVRVETPSGYMGSMSDTLGAFSFSLLEDGEYRLRAIRIGYQPATVRVLIRGGQTVHVDLVMRVGPLPMEEVVVRGRPGSRSSPGVGEPDPVVEGPAGALVDRQALEGGSGMAASGLTGLLQGEPGREPSDPRDALFVRGSSLDTKLVVLEGAPLYTPFHVSGLLPAFDAELLEAAQVHRGPGPVEYDGGLAQVLDLRLRSPEPGERSLLGSADLVSARIVGWAASESGLRLVGGARALHGASEHLLGRGFPYGYGDGVGRIEWSPSEPHRVEATGFVNRESVELDFGAPTTQSTAQAPVTDFPSRAEWGNTAASVGYTVAGARTRLGVRGAWSRYEAALPVNTRIPVFMRGSTERSRAALTLDRQQGGLAFRGGLTLDRLAIDVGAERFATDSLPDAYHARAEAQGTVPALFAQVAGGLGSDVSARASVRAAHYDGQGLTLAPRASLTWLLAERSALTLRAGRGVQLTSASGARADSPLTTDALEGTDDFGALAGTSLLSVVRANDVGVALDQFVTPTTRVGLEGWYRSYEGEGVVDGLTGSGVDLRVARVGASVSGWLGYSLQWLWADGGREDRFDGRQLLSAGLRGSLGSRTDLDLRVSLGDDLPFTPLATNDAVAEPGFTTEDAPDSERLEFEASTLSSQGAPPFAEGPQGDFVRVAAEVSWRLDTVWGGRAVSLRPYVRILNALNRRDALFYYFDAWRDPELRPLAEASVLPVFGLAWRF